MNAVLPPKYRVSIALIKFLQYHNRLEGLMCFVCVWWASWTILFPGFWYNWPVTASIAAKTFGHPVLLSYTLLTVGSLGYLAKREDWQFLRTLTSLIAFICWGFLTIGFALLEPMFSPAVACYSAFAIAELMGYVNHVSGIGRLHGRRLDDNA